MTHESITTVERIVMLSTAGLVVLAMPALGLLVTLTGAMSPMITYTADDSTAQASSISAVPESAEIVTMPVVGPEIRAILLALGLLLLGFLAVYVAVQPSTGRRGTSVGVGTEN